MSGRLPESLARIFLTAFCVLTWAYSLLCFWAPTSGFMAGFYPLWADLFVERHVLWAWAALALCGWALWSRRDRWPGRPGAVFLASHSLAATVLLFLPGIASLGNGPGALAVGILALEPLLAWEAALAWSERGRPLVWDAPDPDAETRSLLAALTAAGLTFAAFTSAFAVRFGAAGARPAVLFAALGWSLVLHMTLFLGPHCWASVVRSAARWTEKAARTETVLIFASAYLLLFLVVRNLVLRPFSFSGGPLYLCSAAAAAALTAALWGECRSALRHAGGAVPGGLDALASPLAVPAMRNVRPAGRAFVLSAAAGVIAAVSAYLASAPDWNHLLQTLWVIGAWAVLFLSCMAAVPPVPALRRPARTAAACAGLALCAAGLLRLGGPAIEGASFLGRFEAREASARAARAVFTRRNGDSEFYAFLSRHTYGAGKGPSAREIRLVDKLSPPSPRKPDIFLIVVDSLRRDYVGAYNPSARFTPEIDAFAKDAAVFPKAFASFSGTALSEPSIWTGALLPQRKLPLPFAPLNSLERLLEHEGYRRFVTFDVILQNLLTPSPALAPLDPTAMGRHTVCGSLGDLSRKLRGVDPEEPVFAYVQPHDLHIGLIAREPFRAPPGRVYRGFYPEVASRLEAADACFGEFIRQLKRSGRYDGSVIVLTSDHGDSLGEEDRWGHAYTIFPEVLRIPLIVRLPKSLRALRHSPDSPAFLTDITPTLYALLGHGPAKRHPLFGEPLFRKTPEERGARDRLVGSSYGPVYGLVKDNGRFLYIADGIDRTAHYFDLEGGTGDLADAGIIRENNRLLREALEELDRFYGLD